MPFLLFKVLLYERRNSSYLLHFILVVGAEETFFPSSLTHLLFPQLNFCITPVYHTILPAAQKPRRTLGTGVCTRSRRLGRSYQVICMALFSPPPQGFRPQHKHGGADDAARHYGRTVRAGGLVSGGGI